MMLVFYTIGIYLMGALIRIAALWNKKARQWVTGRKDIFSSLHASFDENTHPIAWFHCASLGEFEQARPVIEGFRTKHLHYRILLTFYSPSGYEIRKNYEYADWVFYLPLDTASNAKQFIKTVRPTIVFFAKYEFWHYYLTELRNRAVPTILFSAIFRPDQAFFKSYGQFFRNMLTCFTHIFVQNTSSLALLKDIDLQNISVAGDTRIDRVSKIAETKKDIPLAATFKADQPLLIVGSAWQGDLDLLTAYLNQYAKPLKILIAPHEIKEETLQSIESSFTKKTIRLSKAVDNSIATYDVLLIDSIGLLSSLYQYGDFAFIGGGFYDGIHSILEPAVFGMPIFFGPNYKKFQEAFDLIEEGGAFSVGNTAEFIPIFEKLYSDATLRKEVSDRVQMYIRKKLGATEKILKEIDLLC
ncbi:3-deoxy-D-manno-octulosonic acid transferase [Xanthocytophaga flava]|uniref:3-deoxy-D-manno-octulosonic acid transferase n=1 Tax=Xanthocytophaga flava TaxID=3048013 RepID=UPI0028D1ABF3|nr:glycosyltransferase N-terminal domain-containing protein [Xanthocytophaga flavus]MDJ1472481.1 glycosyltransferase N-terminal domain-containing protein [Xanthocytophaga flavus]